MKNRVSIKLTFSIDLDMVPGLFHDPQDWVDLVQSKLMEQHHYNLKVEIHYTEVMNEEGVFLNELATVSFGLSDWARGQFEEGFTVSEVKVKLRRVV